MSDHGRKSTRIGRTGCACSLVCLLLVLALSVPAHPAGAGDDPEKPREIAKEYGIKAACLLRFPSFIKWPAKAFADKKSPFVIGVLGRDPFGRTLDKLIEKEKIQDRDVVIRRFNRLEELKPCHTLFISSSERLRLSKILEKLKGSFTLTVADMKGVCELGVMVNFYIAENNVRFEINNDAVTGAKLNISSRLLKIARIVKTKKPQKEE